MNIKNNPAYLCYKNAKDRCNNPKSTSYKNYGLRGIKFLFSSFTDFLNSVGERPSKQHTLERLTSSSNYEDGYVKWATWDEQVLSRKKRIDSKLGILGVYKRSGRTSFRATGNGVCLYDGKDFFEACCARKSWELK